MENNPTFWLLGCSNKPKHDFCENPMFVKNIFYKQNMIIYGRKRQYRY